MILPVSIVTGAATMVKVSSSSQQAAQRLYAL